MPWPTEIDNDFITPERFVSLFAPPHCCCDSHAHARTHSDFYGRYDKFQYKGLSLHRFEFLDNSPCPSCAWHAMEATPFMSKPQIFADSVEYPPSVFSFEVTPHAPLPNEQMRVSIVLQDGGGASHRFLCRHRRRHLRHQNHNHTQPDSFVCRSERAQAEHVGGGARRAAVGRRRHVAIQFHQPAASHALARTSASSLFVRSLGRFHCHFNDFDSRLFDSLGAG